MATAQERIILGLKVKQYRQERGWNFDELSKQSGISVSYLNEIEKGKKYPQAENRERLAGALGITEKFLSSPVLTKQFAPLGELLHSNFLNEIPLDIFGIELYQVVEIIARAPDRVNAFISALLDIARNYSLRDENFFFAALRAYQELHVNYLDDVEMAIEQFTTAAGLATDAPVTEAFLSEVLIRDFSYKIDEKTLPKHPELQRMRSVFIPKKKKLLLQSGLLQEQRNFQLAREIGFNVLALKERPYSSSLIRVNSFEETLNNFKAAYFAVGLLVNKHGFTAKLHDFFGKAAWNPQALLDLIQQFEVSPEVLFQRFNVLSREFNLQKIFFFRTIHEVGRDHFEIDKELHLNRRHQPHASGLNEHYCRRWLSLSLLHQMAKEQSESIDFKSLIPGAQIVKFADTNEDYLCIAVAKPGYPTHESNVSVMLGILLDDHARSVIRFHNDPAIPVKTVNVTCERCGILDCSERAAAPSVVEAREKRKATIDALKSLTGS